MTTTTSASPKNTATKPPSTSSTTPTQNPASPIGQSASPSSSSDDGADSSAEDMNKLPTLVTPTLLRRIQTRPHLPNGVWYIASSVTLSALNRPEEICHVFAEATRTSDGEGKAAREEQLTVARRMREALVKSTAVIGLPKTINALISLKGCTPEHLLDAPMGPSPSLRPIDLYDTPSSTILHRGETFFNKVYGKIAKRVMGQMDRSGTEDLGVTARLMYGYLLSNTRILTAAESSFVLIASLIPQDVNPQLKGHLKGALNNGASIDEVKAVRGLCIDICEASGMKKIGDTEMGGWGWREDVANL